MRYMSATVPCEWYRRYECTSGLVKSGKLEIGRDRRTTAASGWCCSNRHPSDACTCTLVGRSPAICHPGEKRLTARLHFRDSCASEVGVHDKYALHARLTETVEPASWWPPWCYLPYHRPSCMENMWWWGLELYWESRACIFWRLETDCFELVSSVGVRAVNK